METSGRALVDFTVTQITFGNASAPTESWSQPNGTTTSYVLAASTIQLNATFQQAGQDFSTKDAVGTIEVWHPIGFLVQSWSFNLTLSGGQSTVESAEWTPAAAHSVLSDDGTLHGGYVIRGTVDGGTLDNNEANDQKQTTIPVAIYASLTDSAYCSDPDGDGTPNCPNQFKVGTPQWISGGYDENDVGDNRGHWQTDNGGAEGSLRHFRVSTPGTTSYSANRNDRFHFAWFESGQSACGEDPGHGMGYGQYNDFLTIAYSRTVCQVQIQGFDYLSMQAHTQAWGSMGSGDLMQLEATTGIESEVLNLTDLQISTTQDDWTPVIWNMSDVFRNTNFAFNLRFKSDNLGSTEGIHIDTLRLFGVEKVDEYTIELDCDDPNPNPYIVIPADPNPPSLHCILTNNGYRTNQLRIETMVGNATWMAGYPLRIDSTNLGDHDQSVSPEPVKSLESTEFWVNLSIPEGANVEAVNWTVWLNDTQGRGTKALLDLKVNVDSSFSANLKQVVLATPAAILGPGESANVSMLLRNTGNQQATWNLGGYFGDAAWGASNLQWTDQNGTPITSVHLQKAEQTTLIASFDAPWDATPGDVEVSLVANGVQPANFQAVKMITLEVPVVRDLEIDPSQPNFEAAANEQTRTLPIVLTNNGNSEQAFNLSLLADHRLQASLSVDKTSPLDAFGGTSTILVVLPMPFGLTPDVYPITVSASSADGTQYTSTADIMLTVPMTYAVEVEDRVMSETYRGGEENRRTLSWEITNLGNDQDAFNITTSQSQGMHVTLKGLTNGRTTYIQPGESYDVQFEYWFDKNSDGAKQFTLTATSVEGLASGVTSEGSGSGTFQVGSQGWVTMESAGTVTVDDYGNFEATLQIHNRHPVNETHIRLDVGTDSRFFTDGFSATIESNEFSLGPDDKRIITVQLRFTESAMINLPDPVMSYNITVEAEAGLDVVSAEQAIVVHRIVVIDASMKESSLASSIIKYGGISVGVIIIIGLLVVLVQVLRSTVQIEDEITSLEGYETSLGATYGQSIQPAPTIPEAPTILPAADEAANSMYGGSEEIFKQRVTAPEEAVQAPSDAGPPLPPQGLPEGWTMEQWQHYGQQWLEQNGLA